jgi:hypothetical protein
LAAADLITLMTGALAARLTRASIAEGFVDVFAADEIHHQADFARGDADVTGEGAGFFDLDLFGFDRLGLLGFDRLRLSTFGFLFLRGSFLALAGFSSTFSGVAFTVFFFASAINYSLLLRGWSSGCGAAAPAAAA